MPEVHGPGSDLIGTSFGPYTIVRRLGVGGMAETFEAVRCGPEGFSQRVCLKLALPFLRMDKEFVRLFEREARLAAKLRHSNIVGVLDYGEVEGTPYMTLELVDGVDLLTLLEAQRRLDFEYVALLAVELAKGLSHAHNPHSRARVEGLAAGIDGIVHRDISPSNVMLSRQGEVLLTDFGLAKAIAGASRIQSAVKGKVPYMSPEQLRNEELDPRSDLFSLGVVLYESAAGTRPFDGGSDPATIMRIVDGERTPLTELARGAPERFCRLIDQLLESDRERRPRSAPEVVDRLDEFAPSPRVQRRLGEMVSQLTEDSMHGAELLASLGATDRKGSKVVGSGIDVVRAGPSEPTGASSAPKVEAVDERTEPQGRSANRVVIVAVTVVAGLLAAILAWTLRVF